MPSRDLSGNEANATRRPIFLETQILPLRFVHDAVRPDHLFAPLHDLAPLGNPLALEVAQNIPALARRFLVCGSTIRGRCRSVLTAEELADERIRLDKALLLRFQQLLVLPGQRRVLQEGI